MAIINCIRGILFMTASMIIIICCGCTTSEPIEDTTDFEVIAYYTGNHEVINDYRVDQLTQIIYSFLHLDGNRLAVDNAADSITIRALVDLKKEHPQLKVLLSLGGWGGCKTCSDVFNTDVGRKEFAQSLNELLLEYDADGIDMDWEYPGIEGHPDHPWRPEGKRNFTLLIQEMRAAIGPDYDISFAAGGFKHFFDNSIEWDIVMPLIERVNIMSYDMVGGYSKVTGHHTPLYSTPEQSRSMDYSVRYLDSLGIPRSKMVVGAAFYSRVWGQVAPENNGLYQSGKFKMGVNVKNFESRLSDGFESYWDSIAQAPYMYNPQDSLFATFDDERSVRLKTQYALDQKLGGIMFWELTCDSPKDGLLNSIYNTVHKP